MSEAPCDHREVFDDPQHPHMRRCACSRVRYLICSYCKDQINLGGSEIVWPHTCAECNSPACIVCINEYRRKQENSGLPVCPKCASGPSRQKWIVIFRGTHIDRDRRVRNFIRPHHKLFATKQDAVQAGCEYLPTISKSEIVNSITGDLFARAKKIKWGWVNAPEVKDGYDVYKVELGIFPQHTEDTASFALPQQ